MSLRTIAAPRQKLMKDRATVVATTTLLVLEMTGIEVEPPEEAEVPSRGGVDIICESLVRPHFLF